MILKKQNILIRANSSSKIGLGHIKRDLVLASRFKDDNLSFACEELEGNINEDIREAGNKVHLLKSNSLEELVLLLKNEKIDMIIIDLYDINYDYEKKLKQKSSVKIMVLDDTYEKHYCDIILNHNIYAKKDLYENLVPSSCILECGCLYTLIRDEFKKEKLLAKNNLCNKDIFVAIGGSDHSNLNISILNALSEISNLEVNIVTTKANENLEELQKYVMNKKWIKLHVDSTKIASLMNQSKLAIISASVILNEVFFMNTPFIAIQTAKNQKYMYKYLIENEFCVLKNYKKDKLKNLVLKMIVK